MIVVRIKGGLGNQMFQYATGFAVAKRLNSELLLDTSFYDAHNNRSFRLNHYNINQTIISLPALENFLFAGKKGFDHAFWRGISRQLNHVLGSRAIYREKGFEYDPGIFSLEGDIYLDGYWQSYKYFNDIKDEIYNIFSLKDCVDDANADLADEMESVESVCLHFRRGDYVSNWKARAIHGVNLTDYYSNAMEVIESRVSNPYFFVFSDDISWTKENVKSEYPIRFIDINSIAEPEKDLYLMSKCHHHITANSTFSWWGAWLAQKKGITIAPRRWFRKNKPIGDLVPEGWLIL